MEVRLEIDVPIETLGELRRLRSKGPPRSVAVDQVRSMYPWADELLEKLSSKACVLPRKRGTRRGTLVGLEVDVPIETLGQLTRLERADLPSFVAIDQSRRLYPWVDQLFGELHKKAHTILGKYHERVLYYSLFHDDVDLIYQQASADMSLDRS